MSRLRRPAVGIGVARDHVSVVCVVGTTIRWADARPRAQGEPLAALLPALLARMPRSRWSRWLRWSRWSQPRVIVALGPAAVQVKRLTGLPPLDDPAVITALLRENIARYFLRNGVPLVTSQVRVVEPTVAWAAAFEQPVVEETVRACRIAGLRGVQFVPSVVALPHAFLGTTADWIDGDARTRLVFEQHVLQDARHFGAASPVAAAPVEFVPALAALGARAHVAADAYGATQLSRVEPLALHGQSLAPPTPPSPRRMRLAGAAVVLTALWALLAAGLANLSITRHATATRAALSTKVHAAHDSETALRGVTATLESVAAFDADRPPVSLLLVHLTRALPEGTALVALEVDSAGTGSLVALAPHAAQVVDAVERVPELASPAIVGPVTPESDGGHALERVTIRFQVLPRALGQTP